MKCKIDAIDNDRFSCYNKNKKAGNARRRLLAYPSFSYIETMQNGKVDFE